MLQNYGNNPGSAPGRRQSQDHRYELKSRSSAGHGSVTTTSASVPYLTGHEQPRQRQRIRSGSDLRSQVQVVLSPVSPRVGATDSRKKQKGPKRSQSERQKQIKNNQRERVRVGQINAAFARLDRAVFGLDGQAHTKLQILERAAVLLESRSSQTGGIESSGHQVAGGPSEREAVSDSETLRKTTTGRKRRKGSDELPGSDGPGSSKKSKGKSRAPSSPEVDTPQVATSTLRRSRGISDLHTYGLDESCSSTKEVPVSDIPEVSWSVQPFNPASKKAPSKGSISLLVPAGSLGESSKSRKLSYPVEQLWPVKAETTVSSVKEEMSQPQSAADFPGQIPPGFTGLDATINSFFFRLSRQGFDNEQRLLSASRLLRNQQVN